MHIGASSATSASGLLVVNRYEIDTSMSSVWQQFGSLFQKWKIHSLLFELIPIQGVTIQGVGYLAVLEDPDSVTPATVPEFLDCRLARAYRYAFQDRQILLYKPPTNTMLGNGWLYTQDGGISDDRFEMPGDLIVGTSDFAASVSPFRVVCHYDVSFALVVNSTVSMPFGNKASKSVVSKKEDSQEDMPAQVVVREFERDILDVPTGFKLVRVNQSKG